MSSPSRLMLLLNLDFCKPVSSFKLMIVYNVCICFPAQPLTPMPRWPGDPRQRNRVLAKWKLLSFLLPTVHVLTRWGLACHLWAASFLYFSLGHHLDICCLVGRTSDRQISEEGVALGFSELLLPNFAQVSAPPPYNLSVTERPIPSSGKGILLTLTHLK